MKKTIMALLALLFLLPLGACEEKLSSKSGILTHLAPYSISITASDGTVYKYSIDGETALDYYNLILMDIQMPNMNGYQATEAIRKMDNTIKAGIPIVAMTANAFEEDKKNAFAAGMNAHLAKPIDIAKLTETLAEFL